MNKYIFPLLIIGLDVGSAVGYALHKDTRMCLYWLMAAGLNICVTFQW